MIDCSGYGFGAGQAADVGTVSCACLITRVKRNLTGAAALSYYAIELEEKKKKEVKEKNNPTETKKTKKRGVGKAFSISPLEKVFGSAGGAKEISWGGNRR